MNTRDKGSNNFIRCFLIKITFHCQYFSIASSNSSKSNFVLNDLSIFIIFHSFHKNYNLNQGIYIKEKFNKNY